MNLSTYFRQLLLSSLCAFSIPAPAQTSSGRFVQDLSGQDWHLWLDKAAPWAQDHLYVPPVDVARLPVNQPTAGHRHSGCVSDHKKEVYSALSVVPHGRGRILLCALDMFSTLRGVKTSKKAEGDGENAALTSLDTSRGNPANLVGQQLLLNMLRWSGTQP